MPYLPQRRFFLIMKKESEGKALEQTKDEILSVRENLLAWYHKNRRNLPWREEVSAYHTWVSEIMLQQTRVEAVIPYYERFLSVLPTLCDLAMAQEDLLHKLWEGLGYYNRVRNMKKCALFCVEHYDAALPRTYEELCKLPGIGPYTAGAIASIAYHQRVAAIDGNVLRVFSRLLANEEDISKEKTKKQYREYVEPFLPTNGECGDFNQAVMELGALVCLPNTEPNCSRCPIARQCHAHQLGKEMEFPKKAMKKERRIEEYTVLLFLYQDQIALIQRSEKGLLANLYGFDMEEGKLDRKQVEQQYPHAKAIVELKEHHHIFSHVEWHMRAFLIEVDQGGDLFYTVDEIEQHFAIPTAFRSFYQAACQWIRSKGGIYDKR